MLPTPPGTRQEETIMLTRRGFAGIASCARSDESADEECDGNWGKHGIDRIAARLCYRSRIVAAHKSPFPYAPRRQRVVASIARPQAHDFPAINLTEEVPWKRSSARLPKCRCSGNAAPSLALALEWLVSDVPRRDAHSLDCLM